MRTGARSAGSSRYDIHAARKQSFELTIVSPEFAGKPTLKRHRIGVQHSLEERPKLKRQGSEHCLESRDSRVARLYGQDTNARAVDQGARKYAKWDGVTVL